MYTQTPPKRPVGKFRCSCGFEYSRTGPDQSPESRYRFDRLLDGGPAWENSLVSLYKDNNLGRSEIASRLGVPIRSMEWYACRLKLQRSKKDATTDTDEQLPKTNVRKRTIATPATLSYYRNAWLQAVAKHPQDGRNAIKKVIPSIYEWLRKNDTDWWNTNLPQRLEYKRTSPKYVRERDDEISTTIEKAAAILLNSEGFPVRVTRHAIKRKIHINIYKDFDQRFPLSAETLGKVLENPEDYFLRKIKWACDAYKQEGVRPTILELRSRSRIGFYSAQKPMTKQAIKRALREIDESLNQLK